MPHIGTISPNEIEDITAAFRSIATEAVTVEECAQRWMFHLYDNLLDDAGESACVLVRCFRTSRYARLSTELRDLASEVADSEQLDSATQCIVLLGSAGINPEWNSRHNSAGHRVIPLLSSEMVARSPMIAQLFRQMGVDMRTVLQPADELIVTEHPGSLEIFYVPDALNSPYIPAQDDFVVPYRVGCVVGFGGILSSGSIFAIVMFLGLPISAETAQFFRSLASVVKTELERFEN